MIAMLQVAKIPLSLLIAFAGLFGYLLQKPVFSVELLLTIVGIFLLSTASASLNNLQDLNYDRQFSRTRNRPLPQNLISVKAVVVQAILLANAGILLIAISATQFFAIVAGIAAVVLYNGFYTPMKPKTSWALVPGTLSGMLPPYIGWLAAGGGLFAPEILIAMALLGTWQIPHYWILLLEQRHDFLKNCQIYSVVSRYSENQLRKITFTWVVAFACTTLLLPLFGIADQYLVSRYVIFLNGALLALSFLRLLFSENKEVFRKLFLHLNIALALVMVVAGIDSIA